MKVVIYPHNSADWYRGNEERGYNLPDGSEIRRPLRLPSMLEEKALPPTIMSLPSLPSPHTVAAAAAAADPILARPQHDTPSTIPAVQPA
ncbi:hypothetical protein VTI74DRAFT_10251 [Chaetomium olivicolor]